MKQSERFCVSGNWPVDRNVFAEDEYLSSYVTDRPNPETVPSADKPSEDQSGRASSANITEDQGASSDSAGAGLSSTLVTPEQLKPFPKAGLRKSTSSRVSRAEKTRILTDTLVKAELEQMANNKKQKANKEAKQTLKFRRTQKAKKGSIVFDKEAVKPTVLARILACLLQHLLVSGHTRSLEQPCLPPAWFQDNGSLYLSLKPKFETLV